MLHQSDGQKTDSLWMGMAPPVEFAAIGAMHGGGASGADYNRIRSVHPQCYVESGRYEYTSMLVDTAPTSESFQPLGDYGLHSKYVYAIPDWLCNLGWSTGGRQRSSRPGRGGRQHSTPRDHGRNNHAPPINRSSGHEHGGSAARHYSNLGGRTPIGIVGKKRVQVQEDCLHQTVDWRKIYVEGLPKNCTNARRDGIPKIRAILENILDWPLKKTTDYILAETVALQRYHTEHGRGNHATYGLILELDMKLSPEGYELVPRF
jgi:hypothetical protein